MLRFVMYPSSITEKDSSHVIKELEWYRFAQEYIQNQVTPDILITKMYDRLCILITKVMSNSTITRFYGNTFRINVQIEMRQHDGAGLFYFLLKKRKKVTVMFLPNHHDITISISDHFLFEDADLEATIYHEIIHNLDQGAHDNLSGDFLPTISLIRQELITVTLQSLDYPNSIQTLFPRSVALWKKVRNKPISSALELEAALSPYQGHVYPLSFLIGLQLLSMSFDFKNGIKHPEAMLNVISAQKKQARITLNVISSLSTKKFFRYYKKKVPKEIRYFTDEFLDEIIGKL